jgi:preprotein translocase SecE subunit
VLVICGIVTLVNHGTLKTGAGWLIAKPFATDVWAPAVDPWVVTAPFGTSKLVFMHRITLTMPVLLFAVACWFAWRLVNWPMFADFLIATEAEMNKVSWTTRKRLVQDTIVVLAAVVLMTVFLFVVDMLWIKILTNPLVDVLQHDTQRARIKSQSGAQW